MIHFATATDGYVYDSVVPKIFMFPNLKEVTFVKPVCSDETSPHDHALPFHVPFYWQRQKCDSSGATRGFTHVISEEELIRNEPQFHDRPCCQQFAYAVQKVQEQVTIDHLIQELRRGPRRDSPWNLPTFLYKGVSFDRIELVNIEEAANDVGGGPLEDFAILAEPPVEFEP